MSDILLLVLFPFVTYLTVKLGTYGFLQARYMFNKQHKGDEDGNKE